MAKIRLNKRQVKRVKKIAGEISDSIFELIDGYSTTSVERSILRLYGVDGVDDHGYPLPNRLVDLLKEKNLLGSGASIPFAAAMLKSGRDAVETSRLILEDKISFGTIEKKDIQDIKKKERELAEQAVSLLDATRERKREKHNKYKIPSQPWRYIIVATGNIYEDRTQAESAVFAGADIIAVIRSTAQSLLDYVPYGPTEQGIGGTYATQANFRIMREALDRISEKAGRYIRLVNYASGLCMPEIAACAALEDLDMLLNDSMYGILFRDINKKRTFIDQYFSRLICGRAKIIINTGEDNYLTTSDAVEKAHTVTASQLINEATAKRALLTEDMLGIGHVFEVRPDIKNALLYEIAHALLTRQLFPNSPVKYMPPTRYMSTDIFYSNCMDSMFNLTSIITGQGIHLAGIFTEAIHNPFMHDRYESLVNINYIFNSAAGLGDEIDLKKGGLIEKRGRQVLTEAEKFLKEIKDIGLMEAISRGRFADIKRSDDGGKGSDGVFKKSSDYSNPIMDMIINDGVING